MSNVDWRVAPKSARWWAVDANGIVALRLPWCVTFSSRDQLRALLRKWMTAMRIRVDAGGHQVINYVNVEGDFKPVVHVSADRARTIFKNASETKALLELPVTGRKNSVAMTWKTFDRSPGKTEGQRSPDKGIIEEIDPAAKSILFGDDEAGLKADILASEENPMLMLYYVDVEIVRVAEKIKAYRIVAFHGKESLEEEGDIT